VKAGALTANHNETVTSCPCVNEGDPTAGIAIESTELETIVSALRVRSGLQAGDGGALIPCI